MFDKEEYWNRRAAQKRGQTGPRTTGRGLYQIDQYGHAKEAAVGNKPVTKKAVLKNTKRARKAAQND